MSVCLTTILYVILSTLTQSLLYKRRTISTEDILNESEIDYLLHLHNQTRRKVSDGTFASLLTNSSLPSAADMNGLKWDKGLAASAASVADKCKFEHSNTDTSFLNQDNVAFKLPENARPGDIGENLAKHLSSTPPTFQTLINLTNEWINEGKSYKYSEYPPQADIDCSTDMNECKYFTQIISSRTKYVGCGFKFCEDKDMTLLVCQYYPAGNKEGEYPYDITEDGTVCVSTKKQKTTTDKIDGDYSLHAGSYENENEMVIVWNWDGDDKWLIRETAGDFNVAICNDSQLENSIPVDCPKYVVSDAYKDTIASISVNGGKCENLKDDGCTYKFAGYVLQCYNWWILIGCAGLFLLLCAIVLYGIVYIISTKIVRQRNKMLKEVDDNDVVDEEDEKKSMLEPVIRAQIKVQQFGISDAEHDEMIKVQQLERSSVGLLE